MSEPLVDLVVEEPGWTDAVPDLHAVAERAARAALGAVDCDPAGFEVCVLACDDVRIKTLNADFRERDSATNVLSWPAFALQPEIDGGIPLKPPAGDLHASQSLGDVAISLQTVSREAEMAALPLKNHAMHLILHGCLHLLGFDHERPEDAERMEGTESRLMIAAGFKDPYRSEDLRSSAAEE